MIDNRTCFVRSEFETFLKANGICHIKTSPYHPSSNELAEWAIQIIKEELKRNQEGTCCSRTRATHKVILHATTGMTPCELLLVNYSLADESAPD